LLEQKRTPSFTMDTRAFTRRSRRREALLTTKGYHYM
jgi:hypothetical protein